MNTLVKKTSQIGQVREKCKESNITNIHDIASLYHQQKNIQIKDGTLCYEMITEIRVEIKKVDTLESKNMLPKISGRVLFYIDDFGKIISSTDGEQDRNNMCIKLNSIGNFGKASLTRVAH